ncbi:MAG: UbiX family flavin prenyltransferase [Pirellulaceae bacterium]|jgi:4-hydroxy-3-polyprenylbenzoate decarboxylase|nr:UbiX family flavin prenyltransferase [Pirellulaceae bacterium]
MAARDQKPVPLVLAITGASGAVYATRLLEILLRSERAVHLVVSPSGAAVIKQELGVSIDPARPDLAKLLPADLANRHDQVSVHHYENFMAPIASGSFLTGGMVVCPCSGSTLSGIAHAASMNLVQRAADVHLKERRKLILVPRETPLSVLQLENMHRAAQAGAVLLPAMPGWYHGVQSLQDLVDFVVARILDQLEVPHTLMRRWGSPET